jgi:hypothetical protein
MTLPLRRRGPDHDVKGESQSKACGQVIKTKRASRLALVRTVSVMYEAMRGFLKRIQRQCVTN